MTLRVGDQDGAYRRSEWDELAVWRSVHAALLILCMTYSLYAAPLVDSQMLAKLRESYGMAAYERGVSLQTLLAEVERLSEREKLVAINRHFNRYHYIDDQTQWGQKDYWASPEEFIGRNSGDCEDYVIAKYYALRSAGVPESKLFLTYVQAVELNVAHMVLTYFESPSSVPLVLDNYDLRIVPATERRDLLPVYSFNARSFFLTDSGAGVGQVLPNGSVKNSKWKNLLEELEDGAAK